MVDPKKGSKTNHYCQGGRLSLTHVCPFSSTYITVVLSKWVQYEEGLLDQTRKSAVTKGLESERRTLRNKEGALGNHILAAAQSVCISHRIE